MVLDEIQRFKYRHCYRKQPRANAYSSYEGHQGSTHDKVHENQPEEVRRLSSSDDSMPGLIPIPSSKLQIPQPTVEDIQQKYLISMQEMKFDPCLTKDLLEYHLQRRDSYPWNKLFLHFKVFGSQLDSFARNLDSFQLCSEERLSKGTQWKNY